MEYKAVCRLRACPWCKAVPDFRLPISDKENTNGTWVWYLECTNSSCDINPKTKHVAIRKTTKFSVSKMTEKINLLCSRWNIGLEGEYYIRNIYFDKVIEKMTKAGYRMQ